MKSLLVLTDFSRNAKRAAEAALNLANKLGGGEIVLLNTYLNPLFLPSAEYVAWPPEYYTAFKEESISQMNSECKRLHQIVTDLKIPAEKIKIDSLNLEGPLSEHLESVVKKRNTTLIVMGARRKVSGDFLFGSSINTTLRHASCPVLIVPENHSVINFRHLVFATDLELKDVKRIKYLLDLYTNEDFHLHVCHVASSPVLIPDFDEEDKTIQFINSLSKLNFANISYHRLEGNNITKELEEFSHDIKADLFVLTHHKHSLFWQIFHQSPSKSLIRYHKIPLLILPEQLKIPREKQHLKNKIQKRVRPGLYIL